MNFNFTMDYSEKCKIPEIFSSVTNKINNEIFFNNKTIGNESKNGVYVINFIPYYYETKLIDDINYKKCILSHYKGYLADLDGYSSVIEYLNDQFGSKTRKNIISRLKRLELCFDISYKTFYGSIDLDVYGNLMSFFEKMILNRFSERGEKHGSIGSWDFYTKTAFDLINTRKALLFVIYNKKEPVAISLCYTKDNIFDSAISSYDINYSKFGLGNIMVLKKVEWCLNNNFQIFNMRWGDYKYKEEWCNTAFTYKTEIVYKKNVFFGIKAFKEYIKIKTNLLLVNLNKRYPNIKKNIYKIYNLFENKKNDLIVDIEYQKEIFKKYKIPDFAIEINVNSSKFSYLKKELIEFLYLNKEQSKNCKVYLIDNYKFIFVGENCLQVIKVPPKL